MDPDVKGMVELNGKQGKNKFALNLQGKELVLGWIVRERQKGALHGVRKERKEAFAG